MKLIYTGWSDHQIHSTGKRIGHVKSGPIRHYRWMRLLWVGRLYAVVFTGRR